jgi:hypothetical protein
MSRTKSEKARETLAPQYSESRKGQFRQWECNMHGSQYFGDRRIDRGCDRNSNSKTFTLILEMETTERPCTIVWRKRAQIGVRFS